MAGGPDGLRRSELVALYERYVPAVFRRARLLLGRDADAWDAVQEVFQRVVESASEFRGQARPMTWVYRITTNVCFNHLRARRVDAANLAQVPAEPFDERVNPEVRNWLRVWAEHLTEREATVATLLFVDELTQEEVADVLGLSRKTIGREVEELRQKARALGAGPEEDSVD